MDMEQLKMKNIPRHPKPCVDCLHRTRSLASFFLDYCTHPDTYEANPVWGVSQCDTSVYAMRGKGICGEEGELFEAKPPRWWRRMWRRINGS